MAADANRCPRCGADLPANDPGGPCPRCQTLPGGADVDATTAPVTAGPEHRRRPPTTDAGATGAYESGPAGETVATAAWTPGAGPPTETPDGHDPVRGTSFRNFGD